MDDFVVQMDDLAALMEEFGLRRAKMSGDDWSVEFSLDPPSGAVAASPVQGEAPRPKRERNPARDDTPVGLPLASPTTGIFYASPNPGAPPFVKVGDHVEAGQVVGLIEAMKVFNEITAMVAGTVKSIAVQNGQLVQPGDPLLYIG